MRVWPGRPYPLGATWDGTGVNFAIFSENATKVELCLFENTRAQKESHRIPLPEQTDLVWHCFLPDVTPGQLYGYRIHGPYEPHHGHRFNPNKIVLDPYAKMIGRDVNWCDEMFGYIVDHKKEDLSFDERDNAASAPLASVLKPSYSWRNDRSPNWPQHKTVIYEMHVKGFTQLNKNIPKRQRGTYAGLASKPAIQYLKELGITGVELMPVHHHLDDRFLVEKGLSNYWGYNTLSFFAPESRYCASRSPSEGVREFKKMVRTLHQAGIEVILDVVYNHTAEGNQRGPTLSLRGIDNAAYYRLQANDRRYYTDYTGCGNTLNMLHPRALQLIMDSLRYWVTEMHVDGFRFDLASALARELHEVDKLGAFFDIIHQDPILSQVKLIAEPWDLGEGGYQVGNFPVGWMEWNGKYRDTVRRFWRGDGGVVSEFATRLCGSSDLYEYSGRTPSASINFITSHDGFSMLDLVSYNHKHNLANGEENRDGDSHNLSWNCGEEGPTEDPAINNLRDRQIRNFMATLLLSQGVPMIRHGDEICKTQFGNNNAYCQDNELSWLDWKLNDKQKAFLEFVKYLIQFRHNQPVLHRRKFLHGRPIRGSSVKDISWYDPSGAEMTDEIWHAPGTKAIGMQLVGDVIDEVDEQGERISGDTLFLMLNASDELIDFVLPNHLVDKRWRLEFDTARMQVKDEVYQGNEIYQLRGRSMVVLRIPLPAID